MRDFFSVSLTSGKWKWWFSVLILLVALFMFSPQKWVPITILIPIILSLRVSNAEQGLITDNLKKTLFIAVLGFVIFTVLVYFFEKGSKEATEAGEKVMAEFGFGKSLADDWSALLLICFWAPLGEELLYRGAIFRPIWNSISLSKKLGKYTRIIAFTIASFVSCFLFTSAHGGEGQDSQLVMIFILSLIACFSYYITGSIYAPVLFHSLNNSYVIWSSNSPFVDANMKYYTLLIPLAVCFVLFIIQQILKPLEKFDIKKLKKA